jgi:annexin A7/11
VLNKETSGDFNTVMVATALGPIESHAFFARRAVAGIGTNEAMLTEAIMGMSAGEIAAIRTAYSSRYRKSLDTDVRSDLSMKTKELFMMALSAPGRADQWVQCGPPQQMQAEAMALYQATRGRIGTDETAVSRILTRLNDQQLRVVAHEYQRLYGTDLLSTIKSEFSGHMKDAFIYIVEGAMDKARRDAQLLEDSMKGFGTRDDLLIQRVARIHWDRAHLENVKAAYKKIYSRDLYSRIRSETSGDYREMLLELIK